MLCSLQGNSSVNVCWLALARGVQWRLPSVIPISVIVIAAYRSMKKRPNRFGRSVEAVGGVWRAATQMAIWDLETHFPCMGVLGILVGVRTKGFNVICGVAGTTLYDPTKGPPRHGGLLEAAAGICFESNQNESRDPGHPSHISRRIRSEAHVIGHTT